MKTRRGFVAAAVGLAGATSVAAGVMFAPVSSGVQTAASGGSTFVLEADGAQVAVFSRCLGLGSSHEVVDHKVVDGGGNDVVQKIPGRLDFGTIVCERDLTADMAVAEWRKQVEDGAMQQARRQIRLVLVDQSGTPVAQWEVLNGWPSELTHFVDGGGEREVVEFVGEGTTRVAS